ncbi:DUF397 domain-containing protein [Streptomyces acidiscabies]|uniref:DUF397 domain-containing protein n=1 Tax=Streptomyces acidiscabies TaxID=42234 RepID=A0ABU4M9X6_9ACTN|nr:DUF397 domain-containing protein [Streptomyces acidiscabies]MDX3024919.1 DUF397 domain-containing protein [Streptomyces acidiscabies]
MNMRHFTAPELVGAVWKTSSYSGSGEGQCVELADLTIPPFDGMRAIRDSKAPQGPALIFSELSVTDFLADVRGGKPGC